mmetsp:Transcript_44000/g.137790  ORF Transcript_44000/g.137790 Transcript_44000/m.137790 type:complete len:392 (+) Transcript_44000:1047-2222(+)
MMSWLARTHSGAFSNALEFSWAVSSHSASSRLRRMTTRSAESPGGRQLSSSASRGSTAPERTRCSAQGMPASASMAALVSRMVHPRCAFTSQRGPASPLTRSKRASGSCLDAVGGASAAAEPLPPSADSCRPAPACPPADSRKANTSDLSMTTGREGASGSAVRAASPSGSPATASAPAAAGSAAAKSAMAASTMAGKFKFEGTGTGSPQATSLALSRSEAPGIAGRLLAARSPPEVACASAAAGARPSGAAEGACPPAASVLPPCAGAPAPAGAGRTLLAFILPFASNHSKATRKPGLQSDTAIPERPAVSKWTSSPLPSGFTRPTPVAGLYAATVPTAVPPSGALGGGLSAAWAGISGQGFGRAGCASSRPSGDTVARASSSGTQSCPA